MKKMKFINGIICTVIGLAMMSGCSQGKDKEALTNNADLQGKYIASQEPLELEIFFNGSGQVLDSSIPVFRKAQELTNVRLKNILSSAATDAKQSFSIMMASRQLPDIVTYYGREEFFSYGIDGAFVAIDGLIDEYAPNIKKFLEEREDVRKFITGPDGKIYFIPFVPDGDAAKGWYIRKDWLDKLGLNMPGSVEEYYNALVAFRDSDPNGNGINDEIPYFSGRFGPGWEEGISDLYQFWNAEKEWFVRDGKVLFGPMQTEFKEAIKNISKWYKEKLIDPEIYTRGSNTRSILLSNNTGGSTHDWFGSTAMFNENETVLSAVPDFEFVSMPPPNKKTNSKRELIPVGWSITASNKNPIETLKYFDFWFSEDGRRLANFGIEGEHYDMVGTKAIFKPELLEAIRAGNQFWTRIGLQLQWGFQQDFGYEEQWLNKIALDGINYYVENDCFAELYPPVTLTIDEQKEYSKLITPIRTHREEMVQRWILGNASVEEAYDNFVNELKRMKIDEAQAIQQAAYDRYTKQ